MFMYVHTIVYYTEIKKEHDIFDMIEINSECRNKKMKLKGSLEVLNKCTISKL